MTDNKPTLTVRRVADWLGATVEGDETAEIRALASLETAGPGELTFAADARREAHLADCRASAVIVGPDAPASKATLLRVPDVQKAVATVLSRLACPEDLPAPGVHPLATVADDAQVAADARIGPGVRVGPRAKIGAGTALCANVSVGADVEIGPGCVLREGVAVLAGCRIGARVRIGPNSAIGYDGFGYFFSGGVHHKIPHIGNVVIEDDVEIGACSCVDRAKFGSTRIGAGTKIDNLVQVAHNVQVGRGCILVGQAGIAGSARLGDFVVIGGNAGIRDNVSLGTGAQVAAYSAVASDVPDGQTVAGTPAGPAKEKMRVLMAGEKLPELIKRVKHLEAKVQALESSKDN
ncbi:MAG TPA: UDP-3-O-(3-hydroxymyristoyl)glucosamine N-acyltransferase [Phycisphaerales bacterium]|nr:UDP-3-O-(3-hydroxymyristoyl)glucosamine N-acyltransferase [Phycisphaerales bacterium]